MAFLLVIQTEEGGGAFPYLIVQLFNNREDALNDQIKFVRNELERLPKEEIMAPRNVEGVEALRDFYAVNFGGKLNQRPIIDEEMIPRIQECWFKRGRFGYIWQTEIREVDILVQPLE